MRLFSRVFLSVPRRVATSLIGDLKMATFYDDIDEIHLIILNIPYESDGSIQSWEDVDEEDSDDLPEAENCQNQLLADISDETSRCPVLKIVQLL